MPRHRRHSIEFKRQVVAEYLAGELAHVLGRRHDLSRNLIRIWVEKAGAGELDRDQEAADLLGAYEARIAALERLVGRQALEIEFLKGLGKAHDRREARPCPRPSARRHLRRARMHADGTAALDLLCDREGNVLGRGDRDRDPGDHRGVRVLRLPPRRRRAAPSRPRGQCQEGAAADARVRPQPPEKAAFHPHDGQRSRWAGLPLRGPRPRGQRPQSALGRRHHLRRHRDRLRLPLGDPRCLVATGHRPRARPRPRGPAQRRRPRAGDRLAPPAPGLRLPLRPRRAVRLGGAPGPPRRPQARRLDEPLRQSIRQRQGGELHEDAEDRGGLPDRVRNLRGGRRRPAPLHRGGLQRTKTALRPGLSQPDPVREPQPPDPVKTAA